MPSGKTHERLGLIALGVAAPVVLIQGWDPLLLVGGGFGVLVTPDLDLPTKTHEEDRMMMIPLFGNFWIAFWSSYGWWFSHRGISHFPVLGTLTRVFWLVRPFLVLGLALFFLEKNEVIRILVKPEEALIKPWMLVFFLGWTCQDLVHEIADVIVSDVKRRRK